MFFFDVTVEQFECSGGFLLGGFANFGEVDAFLAHEFDAFMEREDA